MKNELNQLRLSSDEEVVFVQLPAPPSWKKLVSCYSYISVKGASTTLQLTSAAPSVKASGEIGVLYLARPVDACSQLIDTADMYANTTPPFVLIIGGGCSSEDKVRRAQTAGFKADIIYDDEDGGIMVASSDVYSCSNRW